MCGIAEIELILDVKPMARACQVCSPNAQLKLIIPLHMSNKNTVIHGILTIDILQKIWKQ